jgi:hypothetical protein
LDKEIAVPLMVLSATWPLVAAHVLRLLAKRRVGWEPKSISDDPAIMNAMNETERLMKQHDGEHPKTLSD